jgi:hypothetical protein
MRMATFYAAIVLAATTAHTFAAQHRLFTEDYLAIGNEWRYDTLLYMMNGRAWDLHGSAAIIISGASQVSGYHTKVVNAHSPWGETISYASLAGEIVSVVGKIDGEITETLKNNDPLETYPLWVEDSSNNLHIGHGQFQGSIPGYTWTRTYDTYLTYLGQETITVPAGSFLCRKVLIRTEYTDSDGERHKSEDTYWVDPAIGIIKQDTYEWIRYADASEEDARYMMELTSTTVDPQPYCRVHSLPMDFTGDCRVNLADFAVFLQNWMACELEPIEACVSGE